MSVYSDGLQAEQNALIFTIYYIPATIYTFKVWGIWYGLLGIILPIFPIIDSIKHLIDKFIN